jgi:hypothetical protein
MAENSLYFESITSSRAMLLSDEDALAGNTTLSLETQGDLAEDDIFTFINENFGAFLKSLRYLRKDDQELLLAYYLLGKAQNTLAVIHNSTQTVCSFQLRMAVKTLGTFMMVGGEPTEEMLREVFDRTGFEHKLENSRPTRDGSESQAPAPERPLSKVVTEYAHCRNFLHVARTFQLHRPDIRRTLSQFVKAFRDSTGSKEMAVAVWLHSLIDKVSPVGSGYTKRKAKKMGNLFRQDPAIVGEFRINIADADFGQVFVGRANR